MSLVLFVLVWIGVEFKKSIDREKRKVIEEEARICVDVYNNIQKENPYHPNSKEYSYWYDIVDFQFQFFAIPYLRGASKHYNTLDDEVLRRIDREVIDLLAAVGIPSIHVRHYDYVKKQPYDYWYKKELDDITGYRSLELTAKNVKERQAYWKELHGVKD
jgi:hypothetical protein